MIRSQPNRAFAITLPVKGKPSPVGQTFGNLLLPTPDVYVSGGLTTTISATFGSIYIQPIALASLSLTSAYSVASQGRPSDVSVLVANIPTLTGVSYGGTNAELSLPALELSVTATIPAVGNVVATLPSLLLSASAVASGILTVDATIHTPYSISSTFGGNAVLRHNIGYDVDSFGYVGSQIVVRATIRSPYDITSIATRNNSATVNDTLPALTMAPSGQAWLVAPSLNLYSVGGVQVAATYESYAINLSNGAVTHYTNYPFDNVIRLGNFYFGINSTGMYKIGGSKDDTADINAHLKTFLTQFGTTAQKRVPYVYTSGRADTGVVIGITADEGTLYEYNSAWNETTETKNHRTVIGKNIRGSYFSFEISNDGGGTFELDEITAHVAQSERTL